MTGGPGAKEQGTGAGAPDQATGAPPGDGPRVARLLVDGHVHFHACFSWTPFLAAAAGHAAAARRQVGQAAGGRGCLLFTESAGVHAFRRLRDGRGQVGDGWTVRRTEEDTAILAVGPDGECLVLVAGRQIVTAENLEVLAIGSDDAFDDRQPIREVLARVAGAGAVPVIPWGFGKWWFGRGRLVRELVEGDEPYRFFLGDNGGRPRLGLEPRLFEAARARGIFVLPGSDPLPFPDQARRVGSYGFVLQGDVEWDRPASWIRSSLLRLDRPPLTFGRRERLGRFIVSQARMQRAKRKRQPVGATQASPPAG